MRQVVAVAAFFAVLGLWVSTATAQDTPPDAYPAPPGPPPAQPAPPPGQPGYPPPSQPGYPPPGTQPPPPGYQPQPYYRPPFVRREPTRKTQPVAIYAELLGKGFLYGVGADFNFMKWLGIGSAFSYYQISDWSAAIIAPYVNFYPAGGWKNSFLIQAGPWIYADTSDYRQDDFWLVSNGTYVAGQASIGYEYRNGFLFRVMGSLLFSEWGAIPWIGFTFGGAF